MHLKIVSLDELYQVNNEINILEILLGNILQYCSKTKSSIDFFMLRRALLFEKVALLSPIIFTQSLKQMGMKCKENWGNNHNKQ